MDDDSLWMMSLSKKSGQNVNSFTVLLILDDNQLKIDHPDRFVAKEQGTVADWNLFPKRFEYRFANLPSYARAGSFILHWKDLGRVYGTNGMLVLHVCHEVALTQTRFSEGTKQQQPTKLSE
jgi:hypothetical protein